MAAMALVPGYQNGSLFLMKFGDKVIGGQTNSSFNSSADKIYTTNKLTKDHRKTVVRGEFEETVSVEGIAEFADGDVDYTTGNWTALYAAYRAGAEINFDIEQCVDYNAAVPVFTNIGTGKCILTSCPLEMPENDTVKWSVEAHVNEFIPATLA